MRLHSARPVTAAILAAALFAPWLAAPAAAQGTPVDASAPGTGVDTQDLTELSLAELMDLEVTIASKSTEQPMAEVPAAVYVITGDEIRRSGHSSVPEALRMVPGLYVSHWEPESWDVTSRGFGTGTSLTSQAFHNQLLVMVDGIVVYTPLFAGVWWHNVDVDLADVDRIEIVRGPGGILWGSNAVHGVIHIITKDSADTQGLRFSARAGIDDRHGSARYGGLFGENGTYRAWAKTADYDTPSNRFAGFSKDWESNSAGFRADWTTDGGREVTFWTRHYESDFDEMGFDLVFFNPIPVRNRKYGSQLFGSVSDPETNSTWQMWYAGDRQDMPTLADVDIHVIDLEYTRVLETSEDNTLTVGGGYRLIKSELFGDDPFFLDFEPRDMTQNIYRVFALNVLSLPDLDAELTLGLTLEHNQFTQFEVQPTVRGTWRPSERVLTWASYSRAVRTPSLEERTLSPMSVVVGNDSFNSETLNAYEVGVRAEVCERAYADVALFYNDYDDLSSTVFDPMNFNEVLFNGAEGHAYGIEAALDLQPTDAWKVRSGYSLIHTDVTDTLNGTDDPVDDYHPRHQFNLRSYLDLGNNVELDGGVYLVDTYGPAFEIAEHVRSDVRLGWAPCDEFEMFVGFQSWNESTYSEYDAFDNPRRSGIAGFTWTPEKD